MDAEAGGSRLAFDGQAVTIERTGRMARSVFGETSVTIPVERISSVEWKEPGRFSSGHIRFAVAGSQAGATPTPVNRDPNALLFTRREAKAFAVIRDAVRAAAVSR